MPHSEGADRYAAQEGLVAGILGKSRDYRREEAIPISNGGRDKVHIVNAIRGRTDQQNSSVYGLCNQKRIGEDLKQVCTLQREQICKKKIAQISFRDDDLSRIQTPHDGPLVVNLRVRDCDVQTILIDAIKVL